MGKVKEIKSRLNNLNRLNEENVKVLIVVEFLKVLGYDPNTFDFEHPVYHQNKRADIVIKANNTEYFYVETKRGDVELSQYDIIQLANYLNIRSIEWGLLTNGKELILLNNKIHTSLLEESALEDIIVFRINLLTGKEIKYLRFLSREAIFDTRVTNYFKDIAQFRAYKYPKGKGSYKVYKGTLNNFFTYYADKENKYRPLEQIRVDEFEDFLIYEQEEKVNTGNPIKAQDTFKNKYSHIRSMLIELKKNRYITSHHFEEERNKLIDKFNYEETNKDKTLLNQENIQIMLNFFENTENALRDTTILLLCIYMGLERSTIKDLQENMFEFKHNTIEIDGRKIPIPNKISFLVNRLIEENKSKGIRGRHLFYTYYSNKYNVISESAIHEMFKRLKNINPADEKWGIFSAQYIRNCLIEKLFKNNYSIEEISYLTGMDLCNISKYISYDIICKQVNLIKKKRLQRRHPFEKFLEL